MSVSLVPGMTPKSTSFFICAPERMQSLSCNVLLLLRSRYYRQGISEVRQYLLSPLSFWDLFIYIQLGNKVSVAIQPPLIDRGGLEVFRIQLVSLHLTSLPSTP